MLRTATTVFGGWFGVDPLGHLILLVVSVLFTLCAVYGVGYLRVRAERPNRVFCVCLLTFLAMTTTITLSQHLAVMWVAVEGATLSTAVLIYFNHNARSLEAAWKYLMIGSVGIALALLGSLFVGVRRAPRGAGRHSLIFPIPASTRTSSPGRGCAPGSSSCSSATGRRWGSLRSIRGNPTPTARRRGSSAPSWRAE